MRDLPRGLYTSRSGCQYWTLAMGSDGDVPVALTWGHHVGLLVDHRYVPVVLTTAEPGNWVRDLNRHLEEVFLRLPGGACIFDVNGNITCWIRKDALYSAVQALRILFGPCVHGKEVVRLHGLLGTEFVRVADVQSDGNLVLQAMSVRGPDSDPTWTHRLRQRVANPVAKGAPVSSDPGDWEFAWVRFAG